MDNFEWRSSLAKTPDVQSLCSKLLDRHPSSPLCVLYSLQTTFVRGPVIFFATLHVVMPSQLRCQHCCSHTGLCFMGHMSSVHQK